MKIKIEQLERHEREFLATAVREYSIHALGITPDVDRQYYDFAHNIEHGELLLCEYVDTDSEKGGNHGL